MGGSFIDLCSLSSPDLNSSQAAGSRVLNITPANASKIMQSDQDLMIIDIRTPQEYQKGRLDESINLDYYSSEFTNRLKILDKSKTYIIYCRKGIRGTMASEIMKDFGFKEVYNILGGLDLWSQQGRPMVGVVVPPPALPVSSPASSAPSSAPSAPSSASSSMSPKSSLAWGKL